MGIIKRKLLPLVLLLLLAMVKPVFAQIEPKSIDNFDTLSLQDLMNIKITVASITELTTRQSAGVITNISSEEIQAMGARDLMDVLQYVPGFQFGSDVQGAIGIAVRGNWAHEGKVMLLVDGQEMVDGLYSTLQFGNHYPVSNIERVEIIRGPGSSIYGGYAGYSVINVISKNSKKDLDIRANVSSAITSKILTSQTGSIVLGLNKNKLKFSTEGYVGKSIRSLSRYTDVYGSSYEMKDNSDITNSYINSSFAIGKFSSRFIYDNYEIYSRDQYLKVSSEAYPVLFKNYYGELKYDFSLGTKFKLTPKLNYKYQEPWKTVGTNPADGITELNLSSQRISAGLLFNYDASKSINITAGITSFNDKSHSSVDSILFRSNNLTTLEYNNTGVFTQLLYKNSIANITAGAFYNKNSLYPSAIAPRIGFTRERNLYHIKLLYSQSFRSPSTQNIDLSNSIKPEKTDVYELEAGIKIKKSSYLTLNTFYIHTKDPIIFYVDPATEFDAYLNSSETGSIGLEATYTVKINNLQLNAGASYYQSHDGDSLINYSVPGNNDEHLGLSPLKTTIAGSYKITNRLSLFAGLIYYSSKVGISSVDKISSESIYSRYDNEVNINLQVTYHHFFLKNLDLMLAAYNISDDSIQYIQPYNSNHSPLTGLGRTFSIKISYTNF
jgi:outer membrane receptor for ferrienterochelin and colicin